MSLTVVGVHCLRPFLAVLVISMTIVRIRDRVRVKVSVSFCSTMCVCCLYSTLSDVGVMGVSAKFDQHHTMNIKAYSKVFYKLCQCGCNTNIKPLS